MNLQDIKDRVKSITRDFDGVIFREADFRMYSDESIDRVQQVIPELRGMKYLRASEEEPILLPKTYHHLIAIYCASRCFYQDERHYQAANLMNEFEQKLGELKYAVESGDEIIYDEDGNEVIINKRSEYVKNGYFSGRDFVRGV